jgi:peptidoglycan-associated lipoprotein
MRRVSLLLAATGLGLVLTGCPPTYPNCKSDNHCEERGEVCVQGTCQECATDANCKAGFVCQAQKCVPKPECTPGGNECGKNRACKGGKCVVHECDTSADCGANGRCQNNRCVTGCTQNEDCPSGQQCRAGQCQAVTAEPGDRCSWDPVPFEFNEAGLSDQARSRLETLASCIKQQNLRVTLEGHADERGTEEYNLQLSNRRAEAVKRYLVNLGVSARNLDTVGYGENRPAQSGSSEAAWAANRRVEFNRR